MFFSRSCEIASLILISSIPTGGFAEDQLNNVRVMSFNIRYATAPDGENHWDKRKEFLAETIKAFNPDLLGTQETLLIQRDFLAKKLIGYGVFGVGRDDGKEKGEMAALYWKKERFEKIAGAHFWLSETPEMVGSKGWDAALPRMVTWVKLKDLKAKDRKTLLYVNTHFDHRGIKARSESAKLIRERIQELGKDCSIVMTGDFNAGEGSDPYQILFGKKEDRESPLIDTFRLVHPTREKEEGTFNGFKLMAKNGDRIDWIGCSRDWKVESSAIDYTSKEGRTPSDHFPVTAILSRRISEQSTNPRLRVLGYNIHHGEGTDGKVDLPRLAKVIQDAKPDLVALQEVDNKTKRTNQVDQTAELTRLTGLYGKFGKAIDYQGGEYGQAILSRFPIEKMTIHSLPGMPERERRIAVEVTVKVQERELSFISTHLHHQQEKLRIQQVSKLNELFGSQGRPIILVGDLNATPESKPLDLIGEKWKTANNDKSMLTYPSQKPTKQLDYVLFRPEKSFRVLERSVLNEQIASDHRPVFVVLEYLSK